MHRMTAPSRRRLTVACVAALIAVTVVIVAAVVRSSLSPTTAAMPTITYSVDPDLPVVDVQPGDVVHNAPTTVPPTPGPDGSHVPIGEPSGVTTYTPDATLPVPVMPEPEGTLLSPGFVYPTAADAPTRSASTLVALPKDGTIPAGTRLPDGATAIPVGDDSVIISTGQQMSAGQVTSLATSMQRAVAAATEGGGWWAPKVIAVADLAARQVAAATPQTLLVLLPDPSGVTAWTTVPGDGTNSLVWSAYSRTGPQKAPVHQAVEQWLSERGVGPSQIVLIDATTSRTGL